MKPTRLTDLACYHLKLGPCPKCRYDIDRVNWVGQPSTVLVTVIASHSHECDCGACKEYNAMRKSREAIKRIRLENQRTRDLINRIAESGTSPVAEAMVKFDLENFEGAK